MNFQELVRHLAYDVDVNLRDLILLASPLHVEFVRALLDWTRVSGSLMDDEGLYVHLGQL